MVKINMSDFVEKKKNLIQKHLRWLACRLNALSSDFESQSLDRASKEHLNDRQVISGVSALKKFFYFNKIRYVYFHHMVNFWLFKSFFEALFVFLTGQPSLIMLITFTELFDNSSSVISELTALWECFSPKILVFCLLTKE